MQLCGTDRLAICVRIGTLIPISILPAHGSLHSLTPQDLQLARADVSATVGRLHIGRGSFCALHVSSRSSALAALPLVGISGRYLRLRTVRNCGMYVHLRERTLPKNSSHSTV